MARIYAIGSLLVVVLGFALMSLTSPYTKQPSGEFTDLWIWLSVLLWVVAVALTMTVIVPALDRATAAIGSGESVEALTGRVAAAGGVVGLVFVAIVFLMVYQPGS